MNTELSVLVSTDGITDGEIHEASMVVTRRGRLIKNRHGKTAPDNDLCCDLVAMRVTDDWVKLFFPDGECCDMKAAINLATHASPSVKYIQTWSGEKQDTRYQKNGNEWESRRAEQASE